MHHGRARVPPYKRSDEQICDEASPCLGRDGVVDAGEIEVSCLDGVLTLEGTVEDRRMKREAAECVEGVCGVKDVMNQLRVGSAARPKSSGSPDMAATRSATQESRNAQR